jgi:hypothetical protein
MDHGEFAAHVTVYILGGFVLGSTLLVAAQYFARWRSAPSGRRLLPLHVWTLAVSYDLLLLSQLSRFEPFDWRTFLYVPALLLGDAAMIAMLRHQRKETNDG